MLCCVYRQKFHYPSSALHVGFPTPSLRPGGARLCQISSVCGAEGGYPQMWKAQSFTKACKGFKAGRGKHFKTAVLEELQRWNPKEKHLALQHSVAGSLCLETSSIFFFFIFWQHSCSKCHLFQSCRRNLSSSQRLASETQPSLRS